MLLFFTFLLFSPLRARGSEAVFAIFLEISVEVEKERRRVIAVDISREQISIVYIDNDSYRPYVAHINNEKKQVGGTRRYSERARAFLPYSKIQF